MTILRLFSLQGKVALVTGAAGRHTPRIVQALAEAGATVFGADLNLERVRELAQEARDRGLDVHPAYVDLADEAGILALRDQILEREQRIDILVNAAVGRSMGRWEDRSRAFEESMRVNATGLFCITRAVGDVMAGQGSGSIVNIASIQGMVGPDLSLYTEGLEARTPPPDYFFHKGGMISFTRYAAARYGPFNVRCNCVSPGGIRNPQAPPAFTERYRERTLLGRPAEAVEVAAAVVFLASDASAYLTGINLPVDGGYTAK